MLNPCTTLGKERECRYLMGCKGVQAQGISGMSREMAGSMHTASVTHELRGFLSLCLSWIPTPLFDNDSSRHKTATVQLRQKTHLLLKTAWCWCRLRCLSLEFAAVLLARGLCRQRNCIACPGSWPWVDCVLARLFRRRSITTCSEESCDCEVLFGVERRAAPNVYPHQHIV